MITMYVIIIFIIGMLGIILNKRNIVIILMSIEIIMLAVNMNFITVSVNIDDIMGQAFGIYILTVAAAESAIGLAILVVYFRVKGTISIV